MNLALWLHHAGLSDAGRPALGTWQGIYLCEHRDDGGQRTIIATLQGN